MYRSLPRIALHRRSRGPRGPRGPRRAWTVRVALWSARHRWPVMLAWFAVTIGLFVASQSLGGIRAVGATYMFHWMKEAREFVTRNRALLAPRPVWLFSSGPLGTEATDKEGRDVRVALEAREIPEGRGSLSARGRGARPGTIIGLTLSSRSWWRITPLACGTAGRRAMAS